MDAQLPARGLAYSRRNVFLRLVLIQRCNENRQRNRGNAKDRSHPNQSTTFSRGHNSPHLRHPTIIEVRKRRTTVTEDNCYEESSL